MNDRVDPPSRPFRFPKSARLLRPAEYKAVYDARTRRRAGPLLVWSRPNGRERARLGLAIGRKVGNAVRRNAVKRRLREAFRLMRDDLTDGYDLVVSAVAHEPMRTADYQALLREAVAGLMETWDRRRKRDGAAAPPEGPSS